MAEKFTSYSVVLKFYVNGILASDWCEIVDSSTKSGATRKANSILKGTFHKVTKKTQVDNYEYWVCEDK